MSLDVQIKTIIISILFGIFLNFFLMFNKKILYNKNIYIKIIGTFAITILLTFIYFLLLQNVNDGIFHIYEILCITIGYLIIVISHKI